MTVAAAMAQQWQARQHKQHSGAARQAVSASATQTSQGEEARIVGNTIMQCIDRLQLLRRMTGETKKSRGTINQRTARGAANIGNAAAQRIGNAAAQHSKQ